MTAAGNGGPAGDIGTGEEDPTGAVLAALAQDDPNAVVTMLDRQVHHGRPGSPVALRLQVGERLALALAERTGRMGRWIEAFSGSPSPTGRQVACLLLARQYEHDEAGVLRAVRALVDDAHWEVRESAAELLGTLLDRHFDRIRGFCESLRSPVPRIFAGQSSSPSSTRRVETAQNAREPCSTSWLPCCAIQIRTSGAAWAPSQ